MTASGAGAYDSAMEPNSAAPPSAWSVEMRVRLEQALAAALAGPATELLRAARYVGLGGGHRWRGLLTLAAGALFQPEAAARVLPLAAALELLHAASLVLDDLPSMDNALTRRGRACVHLVFPEPVVDMLPAFLVNRAYGVVLDHSAASSEIRLHVLQLLGEAGEQLARGQELDLALARRPAGEAELLECYALKSGALFATALAGGALLCGAGAAEIGPLHAAGVKLGQAYQILDDLADGPEEDGEYPAAGRPTAYSLFGRAGARERAQQLLREIALQFDRFGPAAGRLRGVLDEILPPAIP